MPRDTLTREQIVRTAIALLDDEGLEGLNMRSMGERLNSAATAVYWHVGSKENLVTLAGDEVWGEIEFPDLHEVDWRTAAEAMAKGLYGMLIKHPWLVQAFGTYLLQGPGKMRYDDHNIAVFEMAGFVGAEADQAMATVFLFVLGSALGESAAVMLRRRLKREGDDPESTIREAVARLSEMAKNFPRLSTRIGTVSDSDYYSAPDKSFEFGLRAILDGLERQLRLGPYTTGARRNKETGWFA